MPSFQLLTFLIKAIPQGINLPIDCGQLRFEGLVEVFLDDIGDQEFVLLNKHTCRFTGGETINSCE